MNGLRGPGARQADRVVGRDSDRVSDIAARRDRLIQVKAVGRASRVGPAEIQGISHCGPVTAVAITERAGKVHLRRNVGAVSLRKQWALRIDPERLAGAVEPGA